MLAAAEATGARLVSMENVYMYRRPAGRPLTEDRSYDAHTTKGQLRGRMARDLLAAHQAGPVQVAIARASAASQISATASSPPPWPARPPPCSATPTSHTPTTYIPDIGEGLAVLGEHPDAPGRARGPVSQLLPSPSGKADLT